jgi:hypothetical protein
MSVAQLFRVLGGLAIGLYLAAVVYVGVLSLRSQTTPEVPPIIDYYVTSISTTLATYLGMVLGFRQANTVAGPAPAPAAPVTQLTWTQTIAAWSYVASLGLALFFWILEGFSAATAPLIQNLTTSLIGLFGGTLTVYLNVQPSNPPPGPGPGPNP